MSRATEKRDMTVIKPQRKIASPEKEQVFGMLYLPDRQHVITCSDDASLRVWDLESGKQKGEKWKDKGSGIMWTIALSPGNKEIASGSEDGIVRLWDVETGKVIARWMGHSSGVSCICWSADGGRVVSGSEDGTARVWNVESGETILGPIETGDMNVRAVHCSSDATMIATGGPGSGGDDEPSVKLWDIKTGELLKTLKGHTSGEVLCLAWSTDMNTLISGSFDFDRPIRKFNTVTGTQIATLEGHKHLVKATSLSSNDRILASASSDKTARLWNIENNQPIGPPLLHEDAVRCVAFSPDGKLLVTTCGGHHIYTWDVAAILREAGFDELLNASTLKNVGGKSILEADATQRRNQKFANAHRLPPGFFDGAREHVGSSATRRPPSRSGRGSRTTPGPSSSSRPLLSRLSSFFPRYHHTRPRVVDVATVQDRRALYVAPPRKKKLPQGTHTQGQQQQGQSHGQASSSRPPGTSATATSSTIPASAGTASATAASSSHPAAVINHPSWWTRFVLCICCVSVNYTNGHH